MFHRTGCGIVESRRACLHGRDLAVQTRAEGPRQNEDDGQEVAERRVAVVVVVEYASGPSGMAFGELQ